MNTLILVDIQNDFLEGGALEVPGGGEIIPVINRLQLHFDLVVATQDWHPADHLSFAAAHPGKSPGEKVDLAGLPQTLWPVHCVQGTPGADFSPRLDLTRVVRVFRKGMDREIDSYSGFFDNGHRRSTGLGEYLKSVGVRDVYVAGLATDYCVKFTVQDARALGFRTCLIRDASRGVNLHPDDVTRAIAELEAAGVEVAHSVKWLKGHCGLPQ